TTAGAFRPPLPVNEAIRSYAPGTAHRDALQARLAEMAAEQVEMPLVIGGKDVRDGRRMPAVMPHDTAHVLGTVHSAGPAEVEGGGHATGEGRQDMWVAPGHERDAGV